MTNGARIAYYFGATEFVPDVSGVDFRDLYI
jgi:hypothetical protein